MVSTRTIAPARRAENSKVFHFMARLGFAASGLIHILIGLIAIQVAIGAGGNEADQSGALAQVASTPGGVFVLWVAVVGLTALGLWLIIGAFVVPGSGGRKRAAHFLVGFAKGIVYLVLAFTAYSFARGGSTSSASSTSGASGGLLAHPGGAVVIGLIGVGVFAVGIGLLVKGLRRSFKKDILVPAGAAGRATVALGIAGYVAKAVALGAVGVMFVIAALTGDAADANGLDQGLKSLASLPYGVVILVAVGVGLIAYGVYSFVRARYAKL
ncbi:MAG TPA: DUF1206 domain-containing protein [Galbitalea sp.]